MGWLYLLTTIWTLCQYKSVRCVDTNHEHAVMDTYTEILALYNLTSAEEFQTSVLQEIVHDLAGRLRCNFTSGTSDSQDLNNADGGRCLDSFCIEVEELLNYLGENNASHITEKVLEDVASILLGIAIDYNGTCHSVISVGAQSVSSYQGRLLLHLSTEGTNETLDLFHIQETLEMLDIEPDNHDKDTSHSTTSVDSHMHADELLFRQKCFGSDVLFDQLGYAVHSSPPSSTLGQLSTLVLYHILNGADVSRDCRIAPRDNFFVEEIYHSYGDTNDTISPKAFAALMSALKIGGSQEVVDVVDDGHDHRRKRETDEHDDFLHKESWATSCYTYEQVLAIFSIDDHGIPLSKFSSICPALIQQQLSGACVKTTLPGNESSTDFPTTAEKYGYGTIAVLIVCSCSVVGAFVVKCTSDKSYDIIIALFLGLATGTLYTDAFLHLLPMALGVHGHEDEHAHSESDGIVVEPYVWISLASCAGVYVFYLFEKVLTMVRGKHTHSHGQQENIFSNKSFEVESKYQNSTDEVAKTKTKTPVPSIAIMVCLADAVHNVADGIAMGAAFSTSLYLGVSTTIAVFCHELPHELGDFAILIASGLSFTKALVLNVLVSLTAIFGLYAGLAISEDETVRTWIVAVTAGIFLYISLVNMMPQLLQKSKGGTRDFILNNIGILLGAASMLVLAIFEEKIQLTF